MIQSEFHLFQKKLRQAKSLFHLNEWVRNRTISLPSDSALEISISERNEYSRYFDYSGALTSLYASYETYIFSMVSIWLRLVAATSYTILPSKEVEELRESYRRHVGFCVQHLSQKRFENLGLQNLLLSTLKVARGRKKELLIPEVFFSNLNNLRLSDLYELFSDIKLADTASFLSKRTYLQEFLDGTGTTLESYLSGFVQRRNDVAHGTSSGELLGLPSLIEIADFLELVGRSVKDLLINNMLRSSNCVQIGTIQNSYASKRVFILVSNSELISTTDQVIIQSERKLVVSEVESIKVENNTLSATNPGNLELVGVQIKHSPPSSGKVFRVIGPIRSFL